MDVVLIATPEHWHHRMVLDAIAAGKDVYVEKPLAIRLRKAKSSSRRNANRTVLSK
ncbi:MAG: Gfo/Idh/MocA family oxidoreductase [Bryobacterales bacterium]